MWLQCNAAGGSGGGGMQQHAMRLRTTSNKATLYQATTAAAADFSTAALPFRLKMDSLSLPRRAGCSSKKLGEQIQANFS